MAGIKFSFAIFSMKFYAVNRIEMTVIYIFKYILATVTTII